MSPMPRARQLLIDEGLHMTNWFVNTPVRQLTPPQGSLAPSPCATGPPFVHFIPDPLTYSV
jgi:hypothetical protein